MNNGNFNNVYNGYNSYPYNWDRLNTNIQYTTSLEEALSRCNTRGTENVFFHQDQQIFYRIKVEQDGRKYWQGFQYGPITQIDNTPVVRQDLTVFEDRLKAIENLLFKGEVNHEQSDGQVSIPVAINDESTSSSVSRS